MIPIVRQVKKSSAMTEKAWKGCGQKVGIKIWRIVNFKVSIHFMLIFGMFNDSTVNLVIR